MAFSFFDFCLELIVLYKMQYGVGRIQLAKHGFRDPFFGRCQVVRLGADTLRNDWIAVWDDTDVDYEKINNDTISQFRYHVFPTNLYKSNYTLEQVKNKIDKMEKDELGNVDRQLLMKSLKEDAS